jgi:hypothetical protein
MKIEGDYEFAAPRPLVWEMLLDPQVLAKIMPGCQALDKVGDDEYKGVINIKIGPVQGTFQGLVKLTDLQQPTSYRMQVSGRGPAGIIDGVGDVSLEESDGKTVMRYSGDANVSGRIASVGQRVMDSSARAITRQSLENMDKQIQARLAPPAASSVETVPTEEVATDAPQSVEQPAPQPLPQGVVSPQEAPSASQVAFAMSIARELFDEFVPKDKQPWVLAGVGFLALFIIFNWWTNLVARRVARQLRKGE